MRREKNQGSRGIHVIWKRIARKLQIVLPGEISQVTTANYCRVHSKLPVAGNRQSIRSRHPVPGAGAHSPRGNIRGIKVNARSLRLGNTPFLGIPADISHVPQGGQIACSRQRNSLESAVDAKPQMLYFTVERVSPHRRT